MKAEAANREIRECANALKNTERVQSLSPRLASALPSVSGGRVPNLKEFPQIYLSRIEPLNLTCKWSRIAILRNVLLDKGLCRTNMGGSWGGWLDSRKPKACSTA